MQGRHVRCFPRIAELKISSRDRVSISPRSCVDFVRCAQAEIVCRFRRDRVSISPGNRLGYVGDRLRFERIFVEVENCWGRKSSRKSTKKTRKFSSSKTGSAVDRPGRPHVHSVHRVRERSPPSRPHCLTVIAQVSVGHPVDRAVNRWMGSVDRKA